MKIIIKYIQEKTDLSDQECWWLLKHITKKSHAMLLICDNQLSENEQKTLDHAIYEIAQNHKPIAYILGFVPFLNLELSILPPILIPRPETEHWVTEVIAMIEKSKQQNLVILDIGTGSGCIALSLAQAFPNADVYAVDINLQAIELAQNNATQNNLSNITCIQSDLFSQLPADLKFDLIVSNPPYIDQTVKLNPSVKNWEDHNALFAENHGTSIIEQIIKQAQQHLKKNDQLEYQLVIETDINQNDIVQDLCQQHGYKKITIQQDQFGKDRTLWAK